MKRCCNKTQSTRRNKRKKSCKFFISFRILLFLFISSTLLFLILFDKNIDKVKEIEKIQHAWNISIQAILLWLDVFSILIEPSTILISYIYQYMWIVIKYISQELLILSSLIYNFLLECDPIVLLIICAVFISILLWLLQRYIAKLKLHEKLQNKLLKLQHKISSLTNSFKSSYHYCLLSIHKISPLFATMLPHLLFIMPFLLAYLYLNPSLMINYCSNEKFFLLSIFWPIMISIYICDISSTLYINYWLTYWSIYAIYIIFDHFFLFLLYNQQIYLLTRIIFFLWLLLSCFTNSMNIYKNL